MRVEYALCSRVKYAPLTWAVLSLYFLACSSDQKNSEFRQ